MTQVKKISDKIGRLFKKYGIKSITMDDVARELGISKKTLYQNVSDKEELVRDVFCSEFELLKNQLANIKKQDSDAVLQLINYNLVISEFLAGLSPIVNFDLRKYHKIYYEELRDKYLKLFNEAFKGNLQLGKVQKLYREEIDVDIIGKLHLNTIVQIPESDVLTIEEYTSTKFLNEITIFHLNGLLNDRGRELLEKYKKKINNNKTQER